MHLHFMQMASCFLDLTEFIVEAGLSLDLLIHVFIPALGQTVLFYLMKCKPGREGGGSLSIKKKQHLHMSMLFGSILASKQFKCMWL